MKQQIIDLIKSLPTWQTAHGPKFSFDTNKMKVDYSVYEDGYVTDNNIQECCMKIILMPPTFEEIKAMIEAYDIAFVTMENMDNVVKQYELNSLFDDRQHSYSVRFYGVKNEFKNTN